MARCTIWLMHIKNLNRVNRLVDDMRNVQNTLLALEKEPMCVEVTLVTAAHDTNSSLLVKAEEQGRLTPDIAPMLLMYLSDIRAELQSLGVKFDDHATTTTT